MTASFTGASAFPLTPLRDDTLDEPALAALVDRLVAGSTPGLVAGCEAWYSVLGGTLPVPAPAITRAAQAGDTAAALAESERLAPLWDLFRRHGSLRVMAAVAEHGGLATRSCLPRPIRGLDDPARRDVVDVTERLHLLPPT